MLKTFDEIIEQVLEHEGGYVDDPTDSGGETKYGISKRAYPDEDIKGLTVERAKELYKRDYWNRFKCGQLPDRIRHIYFDMCVNMGGGRATKILQEACNSKNSNKIDVDGGIGKDTIKASANLEDFRLRAYRVMFYAELVMKKPEQERFWVGWFRRSCEV
jgi:lysozyme family protein